MRGLARLASQGRAGGARARRTRRMVCKIGSSPLRRCSLRLQFCFAAGFGFVLFWKHSEKSGLRNLCLRRPAPGESGNKVFGKRFVRLLPVRPRRLAFLSACVLRDFVDARNRE
uniref:Uncharacterized protein n=1 Tax=Oryza sativa subsp. japonica TaxID=39947 RepID=Q69KI9_ORYSJ|nr:hypothetical protein [Oryza sativa Japonica Group]BAD36551.1 hypothetical protein [Oryza sativa Japonica Group]